MNLLHSPILNSITLFAVVLLPLQQPHVANCCCDRSGDVQLHAYSVDSDNCCSNNRTCCHVATDGKTCSQDQFSHSEHKPCHCPAGCHRVEKAENGTLESKQNSELRELGRGVSIADASFDFIEFKKYSHTPQSPCHFKGVHLRNWLCRYLL